MSTIAPPTATLNVVAPRLARAAGALLRGLAWLAVCVFTLLLLAWLGLHWAILPHIDRWRPLIESKTSEALGTPVRIGAIEARSGGWMPSVELHDVVLLDAQLRPALRLTRIFASVSPRTMLASMSSREVRLSQLLIDGAQLEVRRDAGGHIFVAGLAFSDPTPGDDTSAADWLFKQRELAIRNATLRWTDEQRGAPPLALDGVDFVLRNSLRGHQLRLDATPPPDWGERFSLRGQFTQPLLARSGEWQRWSGSAYADASRVDASHLRQYVDLPFELSRGVGAVRAWLDVTDGQATAITADLALRAVSLRLASDLEPLVVDEAQGRLVASRHADGASVTLQRFGFVTGDGVQWPPGDIALSWTRDVDGNVDSGEFKAGRLDLAVIAHAATRLPLGQPVRALLADARPQGIAQEVSASWGGPLDALTRYRVSATLSGVALAARPSASPGEVGRPGLDNIDIGLQATELGGQATLRLKDGALDLPGVFEEPRVALDSLTGTLRWTVQPREGAEPALQVELVDARLANADAQAALHATWKTGAGAAHGRGGRLPGTLLLDGTLSRGIAARVARYLPLGLAEDTRRYVAQAVRGGGIPHANFHFSGDLGSWPFQPGQAGEFRIGVDVDDATFAYVPGNGPEPVWPPMKRLSGELVIDRNALAFRNARAQVLGVGLAALQGELRTVDGQSVLTLATQARGPVADMLRFVEAAPLGDAVHGALAEAGASGTGELKLALTLPLARMNEGSLVASLVLAGNDLQLRRDLPVFAGARGHVDFSTQGVTAAQLTGRVLGGEVAVDAVPQPDGSLRLTAQGSASAEALRRTPALGPLARLAGALNGSAAYRLAVGLGAGAPEIDFSSDLVGMAVDLPPPLNKPAQAAQPLRLKTVRGPGAGTTEILQLDIGSVLHAQYERDVAADPARVLRGGIGVFEPAPTPTAEVAAAVSLPALDIDAWDAALGRLFGPAGATGGSAGDAYLPTSVGLNVAALTVGGRRLSHVTAGLSQSGGQWRANVQADQLEGYVEYRPPGGGGQAGRVYGRLTRLSLPKSDADQVSQLLDQQPPTVPSIDLVIDDFELRDKRLGRLEVLAVNKPGPAREWSLTRLNLIAPEARLDASGSWAAVAPAGQRPGSAPPRQADFAFQLDIADSGELLARLGMPGAIRGGKGRLEGKLQWLGSPLSPDLQSATGAFQVDIAAGQFLQAQTGAARLLGVLSLQALARRLTLDFRDLSPEGFAFDSVKGEVAIARGVASTTGLVMRGLQAGVLLEGSADIVHETQDLQVVIVPEINAGAASLAFAVINPAVGLGTLLAQYFLRDPIARASTREYRITGSWSDPQIEPITRQPGQAAPRIPPPAAPAASSAAP